jgi:hypothetical protein
MNNFVAKSIGISALFITIAVVYYLVIYLPQKNQTFNQQQARLQSENEFSNKQKCIIAGEKLYKTDKEKWNITGISITSDPVYYYNKKLNTCLYSLQVNFKKDDGMPNFPYDITVYDSLTNEKLLYFVQNAYEDRKTIDTSKKQFDSQYNLLFSE